MAEKFLSKSASFCAFPTTSILKKVIGRPLMLCTKEQLLLHCSKDCSNALVPVNILSANNLLLAHHNGLPINTSCSANQINLVFLLDPGENLGVMSADQKFDISEVTNFCRRNQCLILNSVGQIRVAIEIVDVYKCKSETDYSQSL